MTCQHYGSVVINLVGTSWNCGTMTDITLRRSSPLMAIFPTFVLQSLSLYLSIVILTES